MDEIKKIYKVKSIGPPSYYLGNDFKRDSRGRYRIGAYKYIVESIQRVEKMFGSLLKRNVPMVNGDNPELYKSILLGNLHHKKKSDVNWHTNLDCCFGKIRCMLCRLIII